MRVEADEQAAVNEVGYEALLRKYPQLTRLGGGIVQAKFLDRLEERGVPLHDPRVWVAIVRLFGGEVFEKGGGEGENAVQ